MLNKRVIGQTYILDWKKQQALMNYGGKVLGGCLFHAFKAYFQKC